MEANCLFCQVHFTYGRNKIGKFCSSVCFGKYKEFQNRKAFWNGTTVDRATARKYLAEVRGYNCEICGISNWQNKQLTLHVDHINGDPGNSHHSNLRLLCPNCHSQTPFLGNANKGRGRGARGLPKR